jgi:hypothetical protein
MKTFQSAADKFLALTATGIALLFFYIYLTRSFFLAPSVIHKAMGCIAFLAIPLTWLWMRKEYIYPTLRIKHLLFLFIRLFLAYIFCFYATAKLLNLQFIAPPEILKTPAGELEGFWKAWVFFGHSYAYGFFIAATQIVVAFLLLFRSTATAALLLYLFILGNIIMVDFLYGVAAMQEMSVILFLTCFYALSPDLSRLLAFMRGRAFAATNIPRVPRLFGNISLAGALAVLVVTAGFDLYFFMHAAGRV